MSLTRRKHFSVYHCSGCSSTIWFITRDMPHKFPNRSTTASQFTHFDDDCSMITWLLSGGLYVPSLNRRYCNVLRVEPIPMVTSAYKGTNHNDILASLRRWSLDCGGNIIVDNPSLSLPVWCILITAGLIFDIQAQHPFTILNSACFTPKLMNRARITETFT